MSEAPSAIVDGETLRRRVEAAFQQVADERMAGVPILNPAMSVATVGARKMEGAWLTVLVTPWCINLMLLPDSEQEEGRWTHMQPGAKVKRKFPAGMFEFTVGRETGLGPFQMCSLFSPVLEFESQEAALLTAEAALSAMFDAALSQESQPQERNSPGEKAAGVSEKKPVAEPSGISRRSLFLGGKS